MAQETRLIKGTTYLDADGATVSSPALITGVDMTTVRQALPAPKNTNFSLHILGVILVNATAAAVTFTLQRDTAGTPVSVSPALQVPAYSSVVILFPHTLKITAGKDIGVLCSSSTTGNAAWVFGFADAA